MNRRVSAILPGTEEAMTDSRTIKTSGLRGVDGEVLFPERVFEFRFAHPTHIPGDKRLYLMIPEHSARDAEGRPRDWDQDRWVRDMIEAHSLDMPSPWWSHWAFNDEETYGKFVSLLEPTSQ